MGNSLLIGFVRWVWIALLTLLAAVLIHIALLLGWSYASRLSLPTSINYTVLRIVAWFATILAGYVSAWLIPIRVGGELLIGPTIRGDITSCDLGRGR